MPSENYKNLVETISNSSKQMSRVKSNDSRLYKDVQNQSLDKTLKTLVDIKEETSPHNQTQKRLE